MVERLTVNQDVAGSNPATPANRQDRLTCKRKTPYKTAEAAADIIEILRADGKIYSPFASPYKCKVCGWYHWGNKYAP